jgi:hypothetical protein
MRYDDGFRFNRQPNYQESSTMFVEGNNLNEVFGNGVGCLVRF